MPMPDIASVGNPEILCGFRMPIEPSTYPERSPVLSEEERQGIAYLLTLSDGRHSHAFEQQARRIERLTQPLWTC